MARSHQPDLLDLLPPPPEPDMAAVVRPRLLALLATVRAASTMPWGAQDTRCNRILFPQMANWLPEAERDALRAEFAREMARLDAVAQDG